MAVTKNDIGQIVQSAVGTLREWAEDFDQIYNTFLHDPETGKGKTGAEAEAAWSDAEAELERWQGCRMSESAYAKVRTLLRAYFQRIDARDVIDYAALRGRDWPQSFGADWMLETLGTGVGFRDREGLNGTGERLSRAVVQTELNVWRDGEFLKVEG